MTLVLCSTALQCSITTGVWKPFRTTTSCSTVGVMVSGVGSGDAGGATGQGLSPTRSYFLSFRFRVQVRLGLVIGKRTKLLMVFYGSCELDSERVNICMQSYIGTVHRA